MNNNDIVSDLAVVVEMFNAYALLLLAIGGFLIWALNAGLQHLSRGLMERLPARRFLVLQVSTLLSFTLFIAGSIALVLGVLHPPREFLIAAGGAVAVALGFALKDIAASLVAGIMLLFDRPFRVGDRVSFGDVYGDIVSIGLRAVRLQTLDDNLVTIPNSRFITDVVASGNAGALDMMVVVDFHLALDADIAAARALVHDVIVTSRYAYLKKPVAFTVEEVAMAERLALRLRAKAYVFDLPYEQAFKTDIVTRATGLLQAHGTRRPSRDLPPPLAS